MGLLDVYNVECNSVLILFIELVERGNLPAKGRSGVAAEHEHHRLPPAKRRQPHAARAVEGVKLDRGLRVLFAVGLRADGTRRASRPAFLVVE